MMQFLSRLLSSNTQSSTQSQVSLESITPLEGFPVKPSQKRAFTTRDFELYVAGSKYYQQSLMHELQGKREYGKRAYLKVVLRTETDNPHDKNAVRVLSAESGLLLGYLPSEMAGAYSGPVQRWQKAGKWVACDAVAVDAGRKGVYLDLDEPEVILEALHTAKR